MRAQTIRRSGQLFEQAGEGHGLAGIKELRDAVPGRPPVPGGVGGGRREGEVAGCRLAMHARERQHGAVDRPLGRSAVHAEVGLGRVAEHSVQQPHPGAGDRGRELEPVDQLVLEDRRPAISPIAEVAEQAADPRRRKGDGLAGGPPRVVPSRARGAEQGDGARQRRLGGRDAFVNLGSRQFIHPELVAVVADPAPKGEFVGPLEILRNDPSRADHCECIAGNCGCGLPQNGRGLVAGIDGGHENQPVGGPRPRFGPRPEADLERPEGPGGVVVAVGDAGAGGHRQSPDGLELLRSTNHGPRFLQPMQEVDAGARPQPVVSAVRPPVDELQAREVVQARLHARRLVVQAPRDRVRVGR